MQYAHSETLRANTGAYMYILYDICILDVLYAILAFKNTTCPLAMEIRFHSSGLQAEGASILRLQMGFP